MAHGLPLPEKIQNALGWSPETCFEDGIELTIQWYLDNGDWLQGVTSGAYMDYYDNMYSNR